MVALKTSEVEAFVARPDPARPVTLVCGPDAGLVSERVAALIGKSVDDANDPFALVRLDGDALAADPARLVDEANTIPLFGGRRAIWVKAAARDISAAVEALLAGPVKDCRVVIEAGDLRRNAPLRTLCERAREVAVIACYPDSERDLARLIDDEMRSAGLTITADARAALMPLLGGDRRASRNEVQKLALYARGKTTVDLDDIAAVVADASALVLDNLLDSVFAGRVAEVEAAFGRAIEAAIAPGRIVTTALYQVAQLHRARLAVEAGASVQDAADQILGRAQFRRKAAVEAALRLWTAVRLERVMAQLSDTSLDARRLSGAIAGLADAAVGRALLAISRAARQKE
jgi:DNA polymerase-3 subunit delta